VGYDRARCFTRHISNFLSFNRSRARSARSDRTQMAPPSYPSLHFFDLAERYVWCCFVWCRLSASMLRVSIRPVTNIASPTDLPGEALATRVTCDLWLVLDRLPQERLLLRKLALIHQLSLSTGMSRHMPWEIVLAREDVLAAVIRLDVSSAQTPPQL